MRKLQIVGYIRSLLSLELASELIIPELIGIVSCIIPYQQAAFIWLDAQGCVANVYDTAFWSIPPLSETRIPESMSVLIDRKDKFFNSVFYKTLLAMIGTGEAIQSIIRDNNGRALGVLFLNRAPGDKPFSLREQELLNGLDTDIASCLQSCATEYSGRWTVTDERGLLIVDPQINIQQMCGMAHKLILMASHPRLDYNVVANRKISDNCSAVLERLCDQKFTYCAPPSVEECSNCWGKYELSAHNMQDSHDKDTKLCGVMVMRLEPIRLAIWRKSMKLSLTPTQMKICLLLPEGLNRTETAQRIGISHHTVTDHIRKIYDKLGVSSRESLVQKLLSHPHEN